MAISSFVTDINDSVLIKKSFRHRVLQEHRQGIKHTLQNGVLSKEALSSPTPITF